MLVEWCVPTCPEAFRQAVASDRWVRKLVDLCRKDATDQALVRTTVLQLIANWSSWYSSAPACAGFEKACEIAVKHLDTIKEDINIHKHDNAYLKKCAMTALGSKVVSQCQEHFANLAVKSVMAVADIERKDVNFDLIKIVAKAGGALADSEFIEGIVLDKDFSHPQM